MKLQTRMVTWLQYLQQNFKQFVSFAADAQTRLFTLLQDLQQNFKQLMSFATDVVSPVRSLKLHVFCFKFQTSLPL